MEKVYKFYVEALGVIEIIMGWAHKVGYIFIENKNFVEGAHYSIMKEMHKTFPSGNSNDYMKYVGSIHCDKLVDGTYLMTVNPEWTPEDDRKKKFWKNVALLVEGGKITGVFAKFKMWLIKRAVGID
jgi:hypothetical protein